MALASYTAYKAAKPYASVNLSKATFNGIAGRLHSPWATANFAGVAPTTAAVPTAATAGALYGTPAGIATWIKSAIAAKFNWGTLIVVDRLSHQGGLSATVTGAQTTNLPTAALTRYTSGVGVFAALEIYTAVGSTPTTFTASYTNVAGTSGRTSPTLAFGGTNDRLATTVIPIPLVSGDTGVKSVESVTLAASTLTAGAFGVTLFKPLFAIPQPQYNQHSKYDTVRNVGAMFESAPTDACLALLIGAGNATIGITIGNIDLIKQV